jgi:hypothetical protein
MTTVSEWLTNITIICAHAPIEDADEEVKNTFYEKLEHIYDIAPKNDVKIVLGDFNPKIGQDDAFKPTTRNNSAHETSNDNGIRVVDFAVSKNMVISSSYFHHKKIHKVTWCSPDQLTMNQIDHVLTDQRHASDITDVRSMRGADCDTDNFLVCVQHRQRISMIKEKKGLKQRKHDMAKLQDGNVKRTYQDKVSEELKQIPANSELTVEDRWNKIKIAVTLSAAQMLGFEMKTQRNDCTMMSASRKKEERNSALLKMLNRITRANVSNYKEK